MPGEEKPYRVYRAGRRRPRLPSRARPSPQRRRLGLPPPAVPRPRSPRRLLLRWLGIAVAGLVLWLAAWGLAGYFAFREGVARANDRLPDAVRREVTGGDGLPLTSPTTILLLGTDTGPGRRSLRHSDSIMLVRTDPGRHRVAYLSIPRDLHGQGERGLPGRRPRLGRAHHPGADRAPHRPRRPRRLLPLPRAHRRRGRDRHRRPRPHRLRSLRLSVQEPRDLCPLAGLAVRQG